MNFLSFTFYLLLFIFYFYDLIIPHLNEMSIEKHHFSKKNKKKDSKKIKKESKIKLTLYIQYFYLFYHMLTVETFVPETVE